MRCSSNECIICRVVSPYEPSTTTVTIQKVFYRADRPDVELNPGHIREPLLIPV